MARVDFYILDSEDADRRYRFACRLCEKASRAGYRTLILGDDSGQLKLIDDLLWTFRPGSFVSHGFANASIHRATSVVLSTSLDSNIDANLLINLKSIHPDSGHGIDRIIEIVDQNASVRAAGRQRYRHYRDQGAEVKTHQISA